MKKVLSFVLVLAMVLGTVGIASAASYTDVNGKDCAAAVAVLSDLGVLNGYGDGTFKPANNITRAEFCKVIVVALGGDFVTKQATSFKDVPSTHWASGYVQTAYNMGIINGYGAGLFGPEDNVTYEQAVAMVVRALGYKDSALSAAYPTGHLLKAKTLGLLDDVTVKEGAAVRGDVAKLVYAAIDEYIVVYDKDGAIDPVASYETMLDRLQGEDASTEEDVIWGDTDLEAIDGLDLQAYLGANVDLLINADGDVIAVKKVNSTFLTGKLSAGKFVVDSKKYAFYDDADVDDGVAFVNGEKADALATETGEITLAVELNKAGTKITEVYSAQQWVIDATAQVVKADLKTLAPAKATTQPTFGSYKFPMTEANAKEDIDSVLDTTAFVLEGVDALEDIEVDDIVEIYAVGKLVKKIVVTSDVVEGEVTAIKASAVYVDGTKYALANEDLAEAWAALDVEDEVILYLNSEGKVWALGAEAAEADEEEVYAIILGATVSSSKGGLKGDEADYTGTVKVLLTDGTNETYDLDADLVSDGYLDAAVGDVVVLTLDEDGFVTEIADLTGKDIETVTKKAVNGIRLADDLDVIYKTTKDKKTVYETAKYSALVGEDVTGVAYLNEDKEVSWIIYTAIASTEENEDVVYGFVTDGYKSAAKDPKYTLTVLSEDGEDEYASYVSYVGLDAATLYKISVTDAGNIAKDGIVAAEAKKVVTKGFDELELTKDHIYVDDEDLIASDDVVVFLIDEDGEVTETSLTEAHLQDAVSAISFFQIGKDATEVGEINYIVIDARTAK